MDKALRRTTSPFLVHTHPFLVLVTLRIASENMEMSRSGLFHGITFVYMVARSASVIADYAGWAFIVN